MKTKGMGIALLSAAALLGAGAAQAELPWTYGEIGYSKADGDDFFNVDAFDIKGSIGFLEKWHASLQYTNGSADSDFFDASDSDFDGGRIIVGAHPQLTQNTQLIADVTYFNYDYDGGEGSDGYGLGLGLRHALSDKFELTAEMWYTQGNVDDDFGNDYDYNDTTVELGGRYNWTPQISTGLTVGLNGTSGSYNISGDVARFDVRFSFGDFF